MLPIILAVSVFGQTSGTIIQGTTNPPVPVNVVTNIVVVASGGSSTQIIKDRINQVHTGATSVTDYGISVARPSKFSLSNTGIATVDPFANVIYVANGSTIVLCTT